MAGKGSKPRVTRWDKYWESELWNNIEKSKNIPDRKSKEDSKQDNEQTD